jgi:hypothetical protein
VAEVRPTETKYKADTLRIGSDYDFRVIAVNVEGPSEPLQTSEPVEIRKRIGKGN